MRAELEGRPLLAAALALIAGISAVSHWPNVVFLLALAFLLRRRLPSLLWVCGAFLVGLLIAPGPVHEIAQSGGYSGVVRVVSVPELSHHNSSCLIDSSDGTFGLIVRGRDDIAFGQTLAVKGSLRKPHGEYGQRQLLEGARATLLCDAAQVSVVSRGPVWFEWANSVRNSFAQTTEASLDQREALLVGSLGVSSAGSKDDELSRNLARTGTVHLISVSGLQIFLIAVLVQWILSQFPIPRGVQMAVLALVLALYVTASGLHLAAVRAAVVVLLGFNAYFFRREADAMSALGLAAVVSTLLQPWSIYTPSFQLSFITVGALILFWKPFWVQNPKLFIDRLAARVWFLVRTSLVASLAAAPLLAYHFGEIPLLSPVANLLVAPVAPVLGLGALICWGFSFVSVPMQLGLAKLVVGPLAAWVIFCTNLLGNASFATIQVSSFNALWMVPYYGAFLFMWERRSRTR
jgi:competence protein ComEC